MHGVAITELIEKMNLKNMTPDIDADKIVLTHPDAVSYTHLDVYKRQGERNPHRGRGAGTD